MVHSLRKWLLVLTASLCAFGVYLSWLPIYTTMIDWYVSAQCRDWMGAPLQRDSIYQKDGKWIIEGPAIINAMNVGGAAFDADAELVEIAYEFHPLAWELDLEILIKNPRIIVAESEIDWDALIADRLNITPLMKINPKVTINNGIIEFVRRESKVNPIYFEIEVDGAKQNMATITLGADFINRDTNRVIFNLIRDGKKITLNTDVQDLEVNNLFNGLKTLLPDLAVWEISNGKMNGQLVSYFGKGMKPQYEADLTCKDLQFSYPSRELTANCQEIRYTMERDQKQWTLEFVQDAQFNLTRNELPFWSVVGLKGQIHLTPAQEAHFNLDGFCKHDDKIQSLKVEGGGNFRDQNQEAMNISFRLHDELMDEGLAARLFTRQLGEQSDCFEIEVHSFSPEEYVLCQHLAGHDFPLWHQLSIDHGMINAAIIVFMEKGQVTDIRLEKLDAKKIGCIIHPWELAIDASSITGSIDFDFQASNLIESINADLNVQNGSFASLSLEGWELNDIRTLLQVRKGVVQHSTMEGNFAGMKGTIDFDGASKDTYMSLRFEGEMAGLAPLGPKAFETGVMQYFPQDQVVIDAKVFPSDNEIAVEGNVTIQNIHSIKFGFDLKKQCNNAWAFCSKNSEEKREEEITSFDIPLIGRKLDIAGFTIQNGWFLGYGLPLEKFVSPFFLADTRVKLSGEGIFEGYFDQNQVSLKYDTKDMVIENQDFVLTIPRITQEEQEFQSWATHQFDLATATHGGYLPIYNATMFEKNSGILFTDIKAQVYFEDSKIRIPEIETFCTGIYMAGDIQVDLKNFAENNYEICVNNRTISGRLSQIQHLFAHFEKPYVFLKMPMEGNITYRHGGGQLLLNVKGDQCEMQAHVEGALTDGAMQIEQKNLHLEDISLNFAYDLKGNSLDFSDLQGTLLIGKAQFAEEYTIAADHIRFIDYDKNKAEFDIWIGDKKRDVIRLVGATMPFNNSDELVQFQFDYNLTHFGAVHPYLLNLVLKNWNDVEQFDFQLAFDLQALFHDLQRFGRTGLFPMSKHFAHMLDDWRNAEGVINLDIHLDSQGSLIYDIGGKEVAFDEYKFRQVQLKGKKSGSSWMVDQFKLDDWSFAAHLTPKNETIKVNFLGVQLGESLLMGMEGLYDMENKFFDGAINLMEVNMETLGEWEALRPIIKDYAPRGHLKANGKFTVEASKEGSGICVDGLLETSLKNWGFQGLSFSDVTSASCHFRSDRGITIRNLATSLKTSDNTTQGNLSIDRIDYRLDNRDFSMEGLAFNIPNATVLGFMREITRSFPNLFKESLVDLVATLKRQGSLEGSLDIDVASPHYAMKITLKDDDYYFLGQRHEVQNLTIEHDPCEFRLQTKYKIKNDYYWMNITSPTSTLEQGEMTLASVATTTDEAPPALTAHWRYDDATGYYIERVFGPFTGMEFDLVRDTSHDFNSKAIFLEGELAIDGRKIDPLLSQDLREGYQAWGFGSGYVLKGKWEVHFAPDDQYQSLFYFHGDLIGRDFVCKGYQFDMMTAKVDLSPTFVTVRNLEITDPAGILYADQIEMFIDHDGKWTLALPQAKINDFFPSLLREIGVPYAPVRKPLVVDRVDIQDIKGTLGEPASFVGKGELSFSNPPKKNLQNTIFVIPAEILSRIGLDLKVLNPVIGSIHYDIHDSKIFLTRFKDIYSEGKLSKFYLPSTDYKSYVDFDGNLHIQVRMKQYNLVFKLAELFTVTIQGTLVKPTYTLQKQQSRD